MIPAEEEPLDDHHHYRLRTLTRWRQGTGARYARSLAARGGRPAGDADWLDGAFSAGDLMMVSVLLRVKSSGILDEYSKLAAYVARGEARPAYKRAFAAQLAVCSGKS